MIAHCGSCYCFLSAVFFEFSYESERSVVLFLRSCYQDKTHCKSDSKHSDCGNNSNVCAAYIPVYLAIGSSGVGLTINEAVIGLPDSANIFMQMPILGYVFEIIVCSLLYVATGNIMTNHVNIK